MVKKSFGIYGGNNEEAALIIEIGSNHVAVWQENDNGEKSDFELFDFADETDKRFDSMYRSIAEQSLLLSAEKTNLSIVINTSEAIVIPSEICNDSLAEAALKLQFGSNGSLDYFKQQIDDKMVIARYPQEIVDEISPAGKLQIVHKYALLLSEGIVNKNSCRLLFYSKEFIMVIYKENELQLIRHFTYETPDDVLYHILNTFKQLQIAVDAITVVAAGLIDTSSSLHELLRQYLDVFSLQVTKKEGFISNGFKEFPRHYFSTFSYKTV